MIVGLSGKAGAGKDSFANILVQNHGFKRVAFADDLKDVTAFMTGVSRATFDHPELKEKIIPEFGKTPRQMLETIGMAGREIDPDFWVKRAMKKLHEEGRTVITDMRFPNEVEAVRAKHGICVRIKRGITDNLPTQSTHISNTALDHYDFDVVINNYSDLATLQAMATQFVSENIPV